MYVDELKKSSPRMHSSLKNERLKLIGENLVELEMSNTVLLDEFNHSYKLKLKNHLHAQLRNVLIEVRLKVSEKTTSPENILYTAQDKYKYLSEKNPLLDKLKQDFNLDYE